MAEKRCFRFLFLYMLAEQASSCEYPSSNVTNISSVVQINVTFSSYFSHIYSSPFF